MVLFFYLHCTVHPEHKQNFETKETVTYARTHGHTGYV